MKWNDKVLILNITKLNTQGVSTMPRKTSWVSSSYQNKEKSSYRKYMSRDEWFRLYTNTK